jgi:hypothetical protein
MSKTPRQIADNPAAMLEDIDEQLDYNPNLIKQIKETYDGGIDPGAEAALAAQTIYPIWREYLKAYKDHGGQIDGHTEDKIRQTFADFEDLDGDFQNWWLGPGRGLFIEMGEIPIITVEGIDEDWQGEDEYPKHITLKIPLTVPRENILSQFNDILRKCHMGNLLYVHEHSTARYALHARKKFIRINFERMLAVWKLAKEHREATDQPMPWWEIGHRAKLAPGVDPFNDTPARTAAESRQHLAGLASDLYEQANGVMHNAVRGTFPKDEIDAA